MKSFGFESMSAVQRFLIGSALMLAGGPTFGQTAPAGASPASPDQAERVHLPPPVPTGPPVNSAPNPYRTVINWYHWPEGRPKGSIPAVAVDQHDHIWVIERCG